MSLKQDTVIEADEQPSLASLSLTRETDRKEVNMFLERRDIDHDLGGVVGWRACFGARYRGRLVGVVVLSRPTARKINHDKIVEISRYASRPDRPENMGTWLLSKARKWAALEGFEKIIAYAGIAGNRGTLYKAAGFTEAEVSEATGDGWTNREGRDSWDDYKRRKWEYELNGAVKK